MILNQKQTATLIALEVEAAKGGWERGDDVMCGIVNFRRGTETIKTSLDCFGRATKCKRWHGYKFVTITRGEFLYCLANQKPEWR